MFNNLKTEAITNWFIDHGIKVLVIIILGIIVDKAVDRFADRAIKKFVEKRQTEDRDKEEIKQRAETLSEVFNKSTTLIIVIVVFMMILAEVGIEIGPLLAGAGVIGLAIGFGAQNLVRDFFSGLFILIEDQYAKGDVVKLGEIAGIVERITLRKTVLRDLDGAEHHIPNGEIKIASNLTKDWSRVNLDVSVSYDSDPDKVTEVLNQIGQDIAQDEKFKDLILEPPEVWGLDKFGESALVFKYITKTKPLKQWEVGRELRRRIKITFDQEGIEIPYPHRVTIQKKK